MSVVALQSKGCRQNANVNGQATRKHVWRNRKLHKPVCWRHGHTQDLLSD